MSKKTWDQFVEDHEFLFSGIIDLEKLQADETLAREFAESISRFATGVGYDVEEKDVLRYLDEQPAPRQLRDKFAPPAGKNPGPSVTCAVGEEDKNPQPSNPSGFQRPWGKLGERPYDDWGKDDPTATSMALGEEDDAPKRKTTKALGEEGNPPRRTTLAVGEEDKKKTPKPPEKKLTTLAIGEEGKKPSDPPIKATTLAVGEEDRNSPKPPQKRLTTLALGEENKKPCR